MKNQDYDKELRALGYVDNGDSASRYGGALLSRVYRPGAKKKHKLPPGTVHVEINNFDSNVVGGTFRVYTGDNNCFGVLEHAISHIKNTSPV